VLFEDDRRRAASGNAVLCRTTPRKLRSVAPGGGSVLYGSPFSIAELGPAYRTGG
jgi:hypothetical protein